MISSILVAVVALLGAVCLSQYRSLQQHVKEAQQTGFKYVVAPVYFQSIPWLVLQDLFIPLLSKLPSSWTESWLPLSTWGRIWHVGYEPFAKIGEDTIIVVSASGNILWTCDPEINVQVSSRRNDFIKPTEMLGMLNIYGPTITASEGEEHRVYRKVASPSFNDANYQSVWEATIEQAEMMTKEWTHNNGAVPDLIEDASKLALHVLSKVFFGKTMAWTDNGLKADSGHTLTYERAISAVFKYNSTIFMTPQSILNHSPLENHKLAKEAFVEFRRYMEEMRDSTAQKLSTHKLQEGGTLLENFVKAGDPELNTLDTPITPAAVLGNLFIFILAGHETSANTFNHAVTLLACRREFQKALQADLDAQLGARRPGEWSYREDYAKLSQGCVGALMKETLRLYSALPFIPKINKDKEQVLRVGNQDHLLPPNTLIFTNTSATHRNPKYWPTNEHTAEDGPPYPLSDFYPQRWLHLDSSDEYSPPEGAYVPFSEGYRSCMGKRFAETEFCAAIARLFSEYSVELAFEAGDSYDEALKKAEQQLSSGVGFEMGLKMEKPVPLKLVKRKL